MPTSQEEGDKEGHREGRIRKIKIPRQASVLSRELHSPEHYKFDSRAGVKAAAYSDAWQLLPLNVAAEGRRLE